MRKKLLLGMIALVTLVGVLLITPTVQASTFTVGTKTITFEKFKPEGIEGEIIGVYDYVNNADGILFGTESQKIYHMKLDGTIEEMTEEEANELLDEGKLLVDYEVYCANSGDEPEEFSQDLPELTFVEGTGDDAGSYAVKIGEVIISGYDYSIDTEIITGNNRENWDIGNVIIGMGKNKTTNEVDVWINTKTTGKLAALSEETDIRCDYNLLTLLTLNDEGNGEVTILDWSGNEMMSLELAGALDVYICKINTCNQDLLDVWIDNSEGTKEFVYDLEGNKIIETESNSWIYAFQFGMGEYHSDEANTSKIVDIKNNNIISDEIEAIWIDLWATTAKLKNTSEDYLAPGKYYFVTFENEVYEMTISYTVLEGANSSIDKTSEENLTVKTDGDLEKLEGIYVDNEILDESNYTLTEGSTIVTLKNEYLKTLEVGEYTLKVKYLDGEIETKFTITEEVETDDEENLGETPDDENEGTTGEKDEDDGTTAPGSLPNTGKITLVVVLAVLASAGIAGFIKTRKYKEI